MPRPNSAFGFARQGAERAEPLLAWAIKLQDQERPVSRCFPKPREKGAHHLRNECPRKTGLPKANEVPSVRVITKYRKVTESHAGSGDVSSQFVAASCWTVEVRRRGVVIVTNCRGILPETWTQNRDQNPDDDGCYVVVGKASATLASRCK
jgi:hypothetical protein